MREEGLNRCSLGTVWGCVHVRHLHLVEITPDLLPSVYSRVVHDYEGVLLPAKRLEVELVDQVPHEQHEDVLIRGDVTERKVHPSVRIQRGDHGERGLYCLLPY